MRKFLSIIILFTIIIINTFNCTYAKITLTEDNLQESLEKFSNKEKCVMTLNKESKTIKITAD